MMCAVKASSCTLAAKQEKAQNREQISTEIVLMKPDRGGRQKTGCQGGSSYQKVTSKAQTWTESKRNTTLNRKSGHRHVSSHHPPSVKSKRQDRKACRAMGKNSLTYLLGSRWSLLALPDVMLGVFSMRTDPADSVTVQRGRSFWHLAVSMHECLPWESWDLPWFFDHGNGSTVWLKSL